MIRYTHGGAVEGELTLRVEPKIFLVDYLRDNYPGFVKSFGIDLDKYTTVLRLQVSGIKCLNPLQLASRNSIEDMMYLRKVLHLFSEDFFI